MRKIPVLFEDAAWPNLRPLAWSVPCFELRCGMFNLRERVDLLQERLAPDRMTREGRHHGHLLSRQELAPLITATDWQNGAVSFPDGPGDDLYVWLNGRLGVCVALLELVLTPGRCERETALFHDDHLIAAVAAGDRQRKLAHAWRDWEENSGQPGTGAGPAVADLFADLPEQYLGHGWRLLGAGSAERPLFQELVANPEHLLFKWIWQLVPATAPALAADLDLALAVGSYQREPFGLFREADAGDPVWAGRTALQSAEAPSNASLRQGAQVTDASCLWLGRNVDISPQVVIDTTTGPVILDNNVTIMPHSFLQGPLYVGPGGLVKAGAKIYGETSFGVGCRVTGEIGESTFGDFTNKQHDGFIGHAVLGSWVNLGAMTTNSDLKNNYGNVRVDLGDGPVDTELRFVGLLAGDHVKTAIGTLFNTGTVVGFASNIFGGGMPPKFVPGFSWGGQADAPVYALERAIATASVVLGRRRCRFDDAHARLFAHLAG